MAKWNFSILLRKVFRDCSCRQNTEKKKKPSCKALSDLSRLSWQKAFRLKAASSAQRGALHLSESLAFCFDASTFHCRLLLVTSSHLVEASAVNADCDRCWLWVISTEDSGEANEDASPWDQLSFPGTWYFPCAIYFRGTHTRLWKWSQVSSFRTVLPFKKVTKVWCSLMYIVYISLPFFFIPPLPISRKCVHFFVSCAQNIATVVFYLSFFLHDLATLCY